MKIPENILSEFEKMADGLNGFGCVTLCVSVHYYHPRFSLEYKRNIVVDCPTFGEQGGEHDA